MKRNRLHHLKPIAMVAMGILVGRSAHADTTLTFDLFPADQANNSVINAGFGSFAASSSAGVLVSGPGTPDIGLTWGFTSVPGGGSGDGNNIAWDYYIGGVWTAAQLNNSIVGNTSPTTTSHTLTFTPVGGTAVNLESFNFFGYYNDTETFSYAWSVLDGATMLDSGTYDFTSDSTGNHLVDIDYTGTAGQALTLDILRTGGTGTGFNIAVDDINFAQVAPVPEPGSWALLGTGLAGFALFSHLRSARRKFRR